MSCKTCGHPKEGAIQPHNFGCADSLATQALRAHARNLVEPDFTGSLCEHDGCSQPKKEWSGKGAKPKYCAAGHK